MPSGQESLFGQLFCCTSRMKATDNGKSFDGAGVFPFTEGKANTFTEVSLRATDVALSSSKDGSLICVSDSSNIFLLRCVLGARADSDESSLISTLKIDDVLLPFVQVVDVARALAFSRARLYIATMEAKASLTTTEIPTEYGGITCASQFYPRLPGNVVCVAGTESGYLLLFSGSGELVSASKSASGSICSICCDSNHIFVGIKNTTKIEIFSITEKSLVDSLVISNESFGLVGSCLMRPSSRIVDQSAKTVKPVGSLFVINEGGNGIAHINLELKQSNCELVRHGSPISQLLFGPFDNGPVLTAGSSQLIAWESGAFLRMGSRIEFPLSAALVSPARDKPRIWLLTVRANEFDMTSFGLRTGYHVKDDRIGCL